mgnify:CR=1 FL=1
MSLPDVRPQANLHALLELRLDSFDFHQEFLLLSDSTAMLFFLDQLIPQSLLLTCAQVAHSLAQ